MWSLHSGVGSNDDNSGDDKTMTKMVIIMRANHYETFTMYQAVSGTSTCPVLKHLTLAMR